MTILHILALVIFGFAPGFCTLATRVTPPSTRVPTIVAASSVSEHKAVIQFRHSCLKKQFCPHLWADEAVQLRSLDSKVFMAFCPSSGELIGSAEILNVDRRHGTHYLQNVIVDKHHRRRGVANALLNAVIHETGDLHLDVDRDNVAALELYAKCGFVEEHTIWRKWLQYFVTSSRKHMIRKRDQKD